MQDNNLNNNISSREWAMVIDAIPGVRDLPDPEVLRSNIRVLQIDEPTLLPVKGMYIVFKGSVALLFNSQQVATADPGDYFYEEYLVIRQIPMKLEARAAPATRLAFVDSSQWILCRMTYDIVVWLPCLVTS